MNWLYLLHFVAHFVHIKKQYPKVGMLFINAVALGWSDVVRLCLKYRDDAPYVVRREQMADTIASLTDVISFIFFPHRPHFVLTQEVFQVSLLVQCDFTGDSKNKYLHFLSNHVYIWNGKILSIGVIKFLE